MEQTHKFTNELIEESSPYLLQHAHNPVNWHAWNEENLKEAKILNKPLLISIGYSACHWCHVMEHETFENEEVAKIMNDNFFCIKVDREERPDVDQVYMSAVQLITGSGGWPLNCFALPDGSPFHGGTYFRTEDWKKVLLTVKLEFANNPKKLEVFAEKLRIGIQSNEEVPVKLNFNVDKENILRQIDSSVVQWSANFDQEHGGTKRSPKFPLPNNYEFLLRYAYQKGNKPLLDHVEFTLLKMARGGIYDQIGGGFARYSVDAIWKVPHFEKMLYDNGQMLQLYALAYGLTKNQEFLQIITQTSSFIEKDLTDKTGAFYSAYDADSEGVEGKFYTWTKQELKEILGADYDFCETYYNINQLGFWEHDQYILLRNEGDASIASKLNLTETQVQEKVNRINVKLLDKRLKRVAPGLDDKSLTSWNAMMITGLTEVYRVTGDKTWLNLALSNAEFIQSKQTILKDRETSLWHNYKAGKSNINGFLEDYAFVIKAYIRLYETTLDEKWIKSAISLSNYTIANFYDGDKGFFNFTDHHQKDLIHKSVELYDNVIPSSNSTMCRNLIWLGRFTGKSNYTSIAKDMIHRTAPLFTNYPSGFSNWMLATMDVYDDYYELVGVGAEIQDGFEQIQSKYLPNVMLAGSLVNSNDYLFLDRYKPKTSQYFLCKNNACQLPETDVLKALGKVKVGIGK